MLEAIGLDAEEEKVYLAVVDHPGAPESDLARRLGVDVERVSSLCAALEARGLITRSATRPQTLVPASPTSAIEVLVLEQQKALERTRQAAADIERRLHRARPRKARLPEEAIEVVVGGSAINQRLAQLVHLSRREVLAFLDAIM